MKNKFAKVYKLFSLNLYRQVFETLAKNNSDLSTTEYICLESIYLMNNPTVTEFASFFGISSSNAAYKVKQLIKKGYIQKEKLQNDGRVYSLVPTEKFHKLYKNIDTYVKVLFRQIDSLLPKEELSNLNKIFDKILLNFKY